MMTIDEYVKPKSIGEAYALLTEKPGAAVIGGGLFLKLGAKKIGLAIDLSDAGLAFIRETDGGVEIGAMTTFSDLEKSAVLRKYCGGVIPAAVSGVVGTQFRNMVTVGGTVYGRLGFSELLTCLLALHCRIVLHHGGDKPLKDFLGHDGKEKDILEKIVLPKAEAKACFQTFKNTAGSLPILAAAAMTGADGYTISVGARPGVAALALKAMDYLNAKAPDEGAAAEAAYIASTELDFSSDRRASKEYRRELCKVLVKRALTEVL